MDSKPLFNFNPSSTAASAAVSAPNVYINNSLTPSFIARLRDLFKVLDERNRGRIHVRDLPVALSLADLETTADERTGLVAVHCADKEDGLTEAEFLNICDVVYSARKDIDDFSDEAMLRRAFDALANNEHGVVPIEGVLNWGDEVMRACEECLLVEHGFKYSEDVISGRSPLPDAGKKKAKSKPKKAGTGKEAANKKKDPFAEFDFAHNEDDDDDLGGEEDDDHDAGGGHKNSAPLLGLSLDTDDHNDGGDDYHAARELDFAHRGRGGTHSDDDDDDFGAPKPARLTRRRSSSQMLVPDSNFLPSADSKSPARGLRLPEVVAQQRAAKDRHSSFSSTTLGGRKLISHHEDASGIFDAADVEGTTNWLLGTLAERYATATDGEKREIEMLLELARAAGHNVESVKGILTRDAFCSFMKENGVGAHRREQPQSSAAAAAAASARKSMRA